MQPPYLKNYAARLIKSFTDAALSCVSEEYRLPYVRNLKRKFDVLVHMDDKQTIHRGTTAATYGLGNCIGGCVENSNELTLFHYAPYNSEEINDLLRQSVSEHTSRVHFFVPGERQTTSDGQSRVQPKPIYTDRLLSEATKHLERIGVECVLHCYDEEKRLGSMIWIDRKGRLFADTMQSNLEPRHIGLLAEAHI